MGGSPPASGYLNPSGDLFFLACDSVALSGWVCFLWLGVQFFLLSSISVDNSSFCDGQGCLLIFGFFFVSCKQVPCRLDYFYAF